MVLAEKCPNCGAFLPVRQKGVATRRCEFCDLAVPGDTRPIEVPALTPESARAALLSQLGHGGVAEPPPSTWLPPNGPRRDDGPAAPASAPRPQSPVAVVIAAVAVFFVIGLVVAITVARRTGQAVTQLMTRPPTVATERVAAADRARAAAEAEGQAAFSAAGGPEHFDPIAYLPFATARAQALAPDAALRRFMVSHVGAAGTANLTLGDGSGSSYFQFRSPSQSRRPDGTPQGVDVRVPCQIQVNVSARDPLGRAHQSERASDDCVEPLLIVPPRCSVAAVWARAKKAGAPGDAVADLQFDAPSTAHPSHTKRFDRLDEPVVGEWRVSIPASRDREGFFERFADDCGVAPAEAPPALAKALDRARPTLRSCFNQATVGHPEIQAADIVLSVEVGERGVDRSSLDATMDVEGLFAGNMSEIRRGYGRCALRAIGKVLPQGLPTGAHRVDLRLERDGSLTIGAKAH
jgi:hypothetical protein